MRVLIKTESGSTYRLNWPPTKWWREPNPNSPFVRTESSDIKEMSVIEVGKPLMIIGKLLDFEFGFRFIQTTPVKSIEWEEATA